MAAMAERLPVSEMPDAERLADGRRAVLVRAMSDAGLGDSGNHFSPHAYSPHGLVRGSVAGHLREERRFCKDIAAAAGLRLLPDCLDDAASFPDGHGPARTGSPRRHGRGRRELRWRPREGGARAPDQYQVDCRDRRGIDRAERLWSSTASQGPRRQR